MSRTPDGQLGRRLPEFVVWTYAGVVSQVGVAIGEPFEGIERAEARCLRQRL